MSENMRLIIWGLFIVYDLYVVLDYEMNRRERKYDKIRKSHKKGRKASRNRGRSSYITFLWNDLDRFHDSYR